MFKKILIPTDASKYSRHALETGLNIARESGAEIILLHVTYTPSAYLGYNVSYGVGVSQGDLNNMGKLALETTLSGLDTGDVPIHTHLESGYPASVILAVIKNYGVDLVVMGSHGHGPVMSVLGSVSLRVLSHAPCPVLIVK